MQLACNWVSRCRVDLIEGHGERYWPRPGRIFAASRSHTFKQLADAIDDAFARWDRSHLQEFTLADGRRLCDPEPDWEIEGEVTGPAPKMPVVVVPGARTAGVSLFLVSCSWASMRRRSSGTQRRARSGPARWYRTA